MGRPSKLTPAQWQEIERRLAAGELATALAREFGVHYGQITRRVSRVSHAVRETAVKLADAQTALAALPPAQQYNALSLADKLREISSNLASAASLGSATAHRLQALANSEVNKVDDAQPMASLENLRNVGVLAKLANDSASIALNLLAANKDRLAKADEPPPEALEPIRPQSTREEWIKRHGIGAN